MIVAEKLEALPLFPLPSASMDTPFTCHLHTNYIPSIHEVGEIQQLLRTPCEELSSLDNQIHRLKLQLNELQSRRDTLAKDVAAHKALISLIRRIPEEVLQEIFIGCLPDDRNPCMSASDAPLLLTRVCRSWRDIAFSTPRLWSRIHIVLPTHSPHGRRLGPDTPDPVESKIKQRETVASEWLARSGRCPLSVSFYQAFQTVSYPAFHRDAFQRSEDLHISFFENVLLPLSGRWHDLKCFASLNMLLYVRNTPASDVPLLKKLHLFCGTVKQPIDRNIWVESPILQSPCLESVTLSLPYNPLRLADVNLVGRWKNLTELSVRVEDNSSPDSPPHIIYELLRSCPLLESLRLYIESLPFDGMPRPKADKIYLEKLRTLGITITNGKFSYLWPLAQAMDAPFLEHLELDYIQPWNEGPNIMSTDAICIILKDVLSEFGSNLLTWRLRPISGLRSSQFLELLKLTPRLRELSMTSEQPQPLTEWYYPNIFFRSYDMLDDGLIHGLTPSENEAICPELEVFKCISGIDTAISEKAIVDFVRARKYPAPNTITRTIRHLEVTLIHGSDDGITFKLPPCHEEGVTGGVIYKRRVARGRHSPFTGFPFSPMQVSREVGFENDSMT